MIRAILSFFGVIALSACQHNQTPTPAVLVDANAETLDALRTALAPAMGRTNLEFGAGDPTVSPSVAILPPKPTALETQSTAMPTLFDLYVEGDTCFAVRRGDDTEVFLPGVTCRPAD